jgi:hypothetical protein
MRLSWLFSLDMLFGAVVHHTHTHFVSGCHREFGHTHAVELGAKALLGVKPQAIHGFHRGFFLVRHRYHLGFSMPQKKFFMQRGERAVPKRPGFLTFDAFV